MLIVTLQALDEKANYGEFWKETLHKSGADQVADMADAMNDYWWIGYSLIVQVRTGF